MPGPQDFFTPGEWQDPLQADPRLVPGLLQAGISLMQPRAWGQSGLGAVGQAIGSAGEAISRNDESLRKQQETDIRAQEATSRGDLRAAQADAAYSRSQVAQMGAETARERLGIARDRLTLDQQRYETAAQQREQQHQAKMLVLQGNLDLAQSREERLKAQGEIDAEVKRNKIEQDKLRTQYLNRKLDLGYSSEGSKDNRLNLQLNARISNDYNKYRQSVEAANRKIDENILIPDAAKASKKQPVMSYDDWVRTNPAAMKALGMEAPSEPTDSGTGTPAPVQQPPGPQTPQGTTPASKAAPIKVRTPEEATKLTPGTRYETPDGKVYVR